MNPTRLSGMLALFVSAPELVYRAHSDRACRSEIGHVEAIFRYPVKSMGGERLEVANARLARPRG